MNKFESECLAFVIRSELAPAAVGKVVTCIEFRPHKERRAWIVDPPLCEDREIAGEIHCGNWVYESNLQPIQDNPGNEEWFKAAPIEHTTPKKVAA